MIARIPFAVALHLPVAAALACLAVAAGCGDLPLPASQAASVKKVAAKPAPRKKPPSAKTPPRVKNPGAVTQRNIEPPPEERPIGRAEEQAVKRIGHMIKSSAELGPTTVVWLLDRTTSAEEMVHDVASSAQKFYESAEIRQLAEGKDQPLQTAVIAFDDHVQFVQEEPSVDAAKLKASLAGIKTSQSAHEKPLAAVKAALEKYASKDALARSAQRRELILVLVTDEAGEDPQVVDELIEPMRRQAIPLYVIGLPAPWGQQNPFAPNPSSVEVKDDAVPIIGPESCQSERVEVENWTSHYAVRENTTLVDSGFGSFALERLCRATRGKFLLLRPELGYGYRAVSAQSWPPGSELKFDEKVVGRYAPDYVSAVEYQKLLSENKACKALTEAARRPKVVIEGSPGAHFPKDAEAKMAKKLSAAQQFAARFSPAVDELAAILLQGEGDRTKLRSPRWQAEFDLAIGRVLANKARLDGYNSMIAALKRGKTFQKPESKEWVLEPAEQFETESTIRKLAEKAKTYLERVAKEHPGTPWAKIAEEELKLPLGWTWKEA